MITNGVSKEVHWDGCGRRWMDGGTGVLCEASSAKWAKCFCLWQLANKRLRETVAVIMCQFRKAFLSVLKISWEGWMGSEVVMVYKFKQKNVHIVISSWEESQLLCVFFKVLGLEGLCWLIFEWLWRGKETRSALHSTSQQLLALLHPISGTDDGENSLLELVSQTGFTSKILETEVCFPNGDFFMSSKP